MEALNNILGFAAFITILILIHIKLWEFCERTIELQESESSKDNISNEELRLINKILKEKRIKYEIIRCNQTSDIRG
jgi:hypothetical protein